jgi:hypothetical protein
MLVAAVLIRNLASASSPSRNAVDCTTGRPNELPDER